MSEKEFDVAQLLSDLDGGSLLHQIAFAVHESAKSVVRHSDGRQKGKVQITMDIEHVKNAEQVVLHHKLEFKVLQPRGHQVEVVQNESPVHVTARGVSLLPDNQLGLFSAEKESRDG